MALSVIHPLSLSYHYFDHMTALISYLHQNIVWPQIVRFKNDLITFIVKIRIKIRAILCNCFCYLKKKKKKKKKRDTNKAGVQTSQFHYYYFLFKANDWVTRCIVTLLIINIYVAMLGVTRLTLQSAANSVPDIP